MKKLTILFLVSILMVGILGAVASADDFTVHFSNKSLGYYFFVITEESTKRAVENRGWKFTSTDADFNNSVQYDQLETAVLKGADMIIVNPIDSEGIIGAIQLAREKGIPVGVFDTPTMGGDVNITVAFDNYRGGYMAAQRIAELLKEKYGEVKGVVLNAYGALESYAWRLRKHGFDAAMMEYPNITYLDRPTEGEIERMYDVTINTLAEYPNLDAVHAPSETPATGIFNALKEKGLLLPVGHPDHIIFVTIDGEPRAMEWIKQGYLDASVSQDPIAYAEIVLELLERYTLKGKEVPTGPYVNKDYYFEQASIVQSISGPTVVIPPYYIDKSNVDDPRHWGYISVERWNVPFE